MNLPPLVTTALPIIHETGGPLIRLHIGLEDPHDLIADLQRGLEIYTAKAS